MVENNILKRDWCEIVSITISGQMEEIQWSNHHVRLRERKSGQFHYHQPINAWTWILL